MRKGETLVLQDVEEQRSLFRRIPESINVCCLGESHIYIRASPFVPFFALRNRRRYLMPERWSGVKFYMKSVNL